jgi:hypothetical protein
MTNPREHSIIKEMVRLQNVREWRQEYAKTFLYAHRRAQKEGRWLLTLIRRAIRGQ